MHPTGTFDLAAAAGFGFGPSTGAERPARPEMKLAFCTDDLRHHARVALRQSADGAVHAEADTDGDLDAVERQVARVLSLDHDGAAWERVIAADPVLTELAPEQPGLRPVNFHSPYEAAAWAVISARRPAQQASATRDAIARALGRDYGDEAAFPTPGRLLELQPQKGLPEVKTERLHAIARAALEGALDHATLAAFEPAEAMARLQELPGIGPFYAQIVVIRGLGHADVPVTEEPITKAAVRRFYGTDDVRSVSEGWRPFRTWGSVLVHSAGRRAGITPGGR
jgi:DNA-3-methyladenine glycosylase II